MVERIMTQSGVSLTTVGEGPGVLLLHGIGGTADSCQDLAERLANGGRRALCWDAPGYGHSPDPVGSVDHVEVLVAILDELQLAQVALIGTSWGGVIGTRLALEHPSRLAALVLADSTRGSGTTEAGAAAMRGRVDELRELGPEDFAVRRAPRLVSPGADPLVADRVRATMATVRVPGYRAAAQFMAAANTGPRLAEVACPTLVIVGEDDVVTGVPESQLLAESIPGAELAIIPGAGHAAITEKPAAFADLVEPFLTGAI